jgi:hypothetical protein
MVQAIENLTALVVRVRGLAPHPTLPDWDRLDVEVVAAEPVEGLADLLSQRVGERLPMAVRRELVPGVGPGATVRCRAKLHLGEVMAEPHPDPANLAVEPGPTP